MLLVLEIMLTISAWKKGWKGFALLPVITAMFLGLVIGGSVTDEDSLYGLSIVLDIICVLVLAVMNAIRRRAVEEDRSADETAGTGGKVIEIAKEDAVRDGAAIAALSDQNNERALG